MSYELHFSENREIGSNQSDLRIRQSSQYHSTIISQNRFHANTSLPLYLPLYFFIYQIFLYAPVIPTRQAIHIYSFLLPQKKSSNFNHLILISNKGLILRVTILNEPPQCFASDGINLPRLVRTSQNRSVRKHFIFGNPFSSIHLGSKCKVAAHG